MKKVAIITGSSRGIGFEIAKALYKADHHVIVNSSSYRKEVEEKFREEFGNNFTYVHGDISKKETRENIAKTAKDLGRLDILVNNAGIAPPVREDILVSTEENFDIVLDTNLKACYFMTQLCANIMIDTIGTNENYTPRIINIGSMSAYVSSTNRGEYCISKAGVSMITALFADRLAEFGIPVFEIRPGIIKTDMTASVAEKYDSIIESGQASITKRWGLPSDVSKIVESISAGNFDFSTGQIFNADGGFHLRRL